jgi:hypothetical protein
MVRAASSASGTSSFRSCAPSRSSPRSGRRSPVFSCSTWCTRPRRANPSTRP